VQTRLVDYARQPAKEIISLKTTTETDQIKTDQITIPDKLTKTDQIVKICI
jgi:hypothetical protein